MIADEIVPVHPAVTDAESVELRWVPVDEVADLPLLPAFADAWPDAARPGSWPSASR